MPLRPRSIGELIDAAFRLYRIEWKALIGIVALVVVPATFIELWLTQQAIAGFDPSTAAIEGTSDAVNRFLFVTLGVFAVEFLLIQPFLVAAIARAAADVYLGNPISIGRTFRTALGLLPWILLVTILTSIATLLGLLLLVLPGIFIAVRLTVAPAALVVEGLRGTAPLGRSWQLTRGSFWRLLGLLIVSGLITAVVGAILGVPGELAVQALGPDAWPISGLVNAAATVLVTPFSMLVIVLYYFDQRIRKEGFDIEVMAQEIAKTP